MNLGEKELIKKRRRKENPHEKTSGAVSVSGHGAESVHVRGFRGRRHRQHRDLRRAFSLGRGFVGR